MNAKAGITILILILGVGGAISFNELTRSTDTGAVVIVEGQEPNVMAYNAATGEEFEVMQYFYAVETYDEVLVPLVYASEFITTEDKDRFVVVSETVLSQMEWSEIDKGVEMVMLHVNKNREFPVWIEVIRVSD